MHRTCLLMAMSVICNALNTVNSHSVHTVRESHDTFDSRLVSCTDHIFVHRKYRYRYCLERYSRIITITYYAHSKSYILTSLWFFTIFLVLSFSVIVCFHHSLSCVYWYYQAMVVSYFQSLGQWFCFSLKSWCTQQKLV